MANERITPLTEQIEKCKEAQKETAKAEKGKGRRKKDADESDENE